MADEKYTFEQARIRLEEIAAEVRKKDTSLEKSLDLLEEGVRLANICTELVDHPDMSASVQVPAPESGADDASAEGAEAADGGDPTDGDAGSGSSVVPDEDTHEAVGDELDGADVDGFDDVEEPSVAPDDGGTQD